MIRERQTDRQIDRQTDRDRQTIRQTDRDIPYTGWNILKRRSKEKTKNENSFEREK